MSGMVEYPHRITEAVRFSETDMLGHVNNTVFGIYFEAGRSTYLADHGFHRQPGVNLVIIKTEIVFLDMIYWPGDVTVGTRAGKAGRSSFAMEQLLCQGDRTASWC
jgi:acyl-CoA thioester hydrolase